MWLSTRAPKMLEASLLSIAGLSLRALAQFGPQRTVQQCMCFLFAATVVMAKLKRVGDTCSNPLTESASLVGFQLVCASVCGTLGTPLWIYMLVAAVSAWSDLSILDGFMSGTTSEHPQAAYLGSAVVTAITYASWHEMSKSMHKTLLELAQASDQKERYIAALSHDFGTPTAALGMALEALDEAARKAVGEEALSGMRAAVNLLSQIKAKATSIGQLAAGERLQPRLVAVSMRDVVAQVRGISRLMHTKPNLRVSFEIAPDVAKHVLTDRAWVNMMLTNLLSNALKHCMQGEVSLRVRVVGGELCCSVTDTGIGVAPHFVGLLFTEYTKGSKWSSGTGIGLFHVRKLAEAMSGRAEYSPNTPAGSIFSFMVPYTPLTEHIAEDDQLFAAPGSPTGLTSPAPAGRAESEVEGEGEGEVEVPAAAAALASGGGGLQVLLVDDDEFIQNILESWCRGEGASVQTAGDGQEALELLCRQPRPALVFMDVMMPWMDGIECTRRVREWEREMGAAPVIIYAVSANGDDEACVRDCMAAGTDGVITKPLFGPQLKKILHRHRDRAA
jgi:signal transduction histidine kinase